MMGGRTIAGQYDRSQPDRSQYNRPQYDRAQRDRPQYDRPQYDRSDDQKQQMFGRVDPFCIFAVLPMLVMAGFFIWGDIAVVGVVLIFLALLIVVVDSWANRPVKRSAPRSRDDY